MKPEAEFIPDLLFLRLNQDHFIKIHSLIISIDVLEFI